MYWHFDSVPVPEIDMDVFNVWASGDYHYIGDVMVDNIDELWAAFVADFRAGDPDSDGSPTVVFGDDDTVVSRTEFGDYVWRAVARKIYGE